jgi:hypothetical protein
MLHDVAARYERGRYQLYVTRFSHARKSKSQAREMDHMDYQNYAVAEDRIFNGTRRTLNPDGFGNEGGDRQCIQKQKYMAAC